MIQKWNNAIVTFFSKIHKHLFKFTILTYLSEASAALTYAWSQLRLTCVLLLN